MMKSKIVVPGTRIGHESEYAAGEGTYKRDGYIYASRLGTSIPQKDPSDKLITVHVSPSKSSGGSSKIPTVNSIVIGRVTKMTFQYANVDIMVVDGVPVREPFSGTIRKQDVQSFDKDKVDLSKCFLTGDIVKAEVISMGDTLAYYLSTAKNELGVIYAESENGAAMIPIAWDKMECTKTGSVEMRKCAKP